MSQMTLQFASLMFRLPAPVSVLVLVLVLLPLLPVVVLLLPLSSSNKARARTQALTSCLVVQHTSDRSLRRPMTLRKPLLR